MMARVKHRTAVYGFTLIEMMLSLVLVGLVVTLTGQLTVQNLRTGKIVEETVDRHTRADRVLSSFSADIDSRLSNDIKLTLDANHRPMIEITCLAAVPGDELHVRYLPSVVTYQLVRQAERDITDDSTMLCLVRRVQELTGSASPRTEAMITAGLASFVVEVRVGPAWHSLTSKLAEALREPTNFRIKYKLAGADEPITRTYVICDEDPED